MRPSLHLIGGWSYATASMNALAAHLSDSCDVVPHAFDCRLSELNPLSEPWLLAGWSLGGLRVLEAVSNGTLKPSGIILISSTARFCSDDHYACGVKRSMLKSMMMGIKKQRARTLEQFYRDAVFPENAETDLLSERKQQSSRFNDDTLQRGLQMLDIMDFRDSITSIKVPALLLHGDKDRIITSDAPRFLLSKMPSVAQLNIHPEAGHEMIIHNADWVAAQIIEFSGRLG